MADRLQRPDVHRPRLPLTARAVVELHVLELEHQVELAAARVGEQPRLLDRHTRHLPNGQVPARAIGEHFLVHLAQELVDARAVPVARTRPRGAAKGVRLAFIIAADAIQDGIRQDRAPRASDVNVEINGPKAEQWCRGAAVIAIQTFVLGLHPSPDGAQ